MAILALVFLRETYGPVLLAREESRDKGKTILGSPTIRPHESWKRVLRGPWVRPMKMLARSPIVALFAFYTTITNSYLLLIIATFGTVYQNEYKFRAGPSGLAYFGMTIGFFVSHVSLGHFSDRYVTLMEKRRGRLKPEYRLPPLIVGSILIPGGLFCYGWSAQYHTHWTVPIIGSSLIAFGIMFIYLPVQMYLVDIYTIYAASAMGACTVVRSVGAAVLPLAANPLYDRLGYGWGNTVLAFVAMAFIPFAVLLLRYGERIRTNPRFQPKL